MRTRKMARLELSSREDSSVDDGEIEPEVGATDGEEEAKKVVMRQALLNPLIVHEILKYLDFQDLKSCRVVSKMWKSLSSPIILQQDYSIVRIKYNSKEKCYQQQQEESTCTLPKLAQLNDLILKSSPQLFPCTNFVFHGGNLGNVEAQRFFKLNGLNIKCLEVSNISLYCQGKTGRRKSREKPDPSCFTTKSVFRKILHKDLPNLTSLSIKDFDFNWNEGDKLSLPKLESFTWEGGRRTVLKILNCTPNLKTIKKILNYDDLIIITRSNNRQARKKCMLFVLNYNNNKNV